MSSVIKKKKETLLNKVFRKIKPELLTNNQRDVINNIPLEDVRIDNNELIEIATRRNELKTFKPDNSNAMVTFNDHS